MINTTNSLNKINNIFASFATRSQMLNGNYGFGTTDNIGASKEMKFPYMWVFWLGNEYTDNGYSEIYQFQIYFFDKIQFGEDNTVDVLSDMQYLYRQFVGEIFRHPYYDDLGLQLIENRITSKAVNLATDANVSGVQLNLYIKEPVFISYDISPVLPITIEEELGGIGYWIIENDFIVS